MTRQKRTTWVLEALLVNIKWQKSNEGISCFAVASPIDFFFMLIFLGVCVTCNGFVFDALFKQAMISNCTHDTPPYSTQANVIKMCTVSSIALYLEVPKLNHKYL